MKRLSFLAALFGLPALAQTKKQDASTLTLPCWGDSHGGGCGTHPTEKINFFLDKGKPLNNQCPVCGTMAEPFVPKFQSGGDCVVLDDKNGFKPCGPPIQLARCKQCNCAFWQDSEK